MVQDFEWPVLEYRYARGPDAARSNFRRLDAAQRWARAFACALISEFAHRGYCDFYRDFAAVFPTTISWEARILHATDESGRARRVAAMTEVAGYFSELIDEKRAHPSKRTDDIVGHAIDWKMDGQAPSDADYFDKPRPRHIGSARDLIAVSVHIWRVRK